jgi:hypothetical protein
MTNVLEGGHACPKDSARVTADALDALDHPTTVVRKGVFEGVRDTFTRV